VENEAAQAAVRQDAATETMAPNEAHVPQNSGTVDILLPSLVEELQVQAGIMSSIAHLGLESALPTTEEDP
jgi:hypothetical protein